MAEGWQATPYQLALTDGKNLGMSTFLTRLVDEETEKNDLDIVREVLKVTKELPIERACDFSFTKKADSEMTQVGCKP